MKVAVLGLWHLGSVTAACAAAAGHQVTGWDPDADTIGALNAGRAPIAEPGLDALVASGLMSGHLRFTGDARSAVGDAEVVWITFDTPVDDEDRADVNYVMRQVAEAFPHLKDGAVVLSSSQLPVGSVARLERAFAETAAAVASRSRVLPRTCGSAKRSMSSRIPTGSSLACGMTVRRQC